MPTYYEMLKLTPTATAVEIEAAIEAQYHQWRRLVTHHDPNIVNQATQALQTLETIRTTLTNAEKRAVYDAAIGISGPVGGLADPEALLRATAPSPPPAPPAKSQTPVAVSQHPDAWICPKCHKANPIGTRFCNQCGQQLGRQCPKCQQWTEAAFAFCAFCGENMDTFSQRQEHEIQQTISNAFTQISDLIRRVQRVRDQSELNRIEQQIISLGQQIADQVKSIPDPEATSIILRLARVMKQENEVIQQRRRSLK